MVTFGAQVPRADDDRVGDGPQEPHHRPVVRVPAADPRTGSARRIDSDDRVHARDAVREHEPPVGPRAHAQRSVEREALWRSGSVSPEVSSKSRSSGCIC